MSFCEYTTVSAICIFFLSIAILKLDLKLNLSDATNKIKIWYWFSFVKSTVNPVDEWKSKPLLQNSSERWICFSHYNNNSSNVRICAHAAHTSTRVNHHITRHFWISALFRKSFDKSWGTRKLVKSFCLRNNKKVQRTNT